MICLLGMALVGFQSVAGGLAGYRTASVQATEVSTVLEQLSQTRLAFSAYDRARSDERRAELQSALAQFQAAHADAQARGTIATSAEVETALPAYAAAVTAILGVDAEIAATRASMDQSGVDATATLSSLIEQTSQSSNLNAKAAALSGLAMQQLLSTRLLVTELLAEPTAANLTAVQEAAQGAVTALADLRATFFRADDLSRVDSVSAAMETYRASIEAVHTQLDTRAGLAADLAAADTQLAEAFGADVAAIVTGQEQAGAIAEGQASWTQTAMLVLGGSAVVIGALLAMLMARWLSGVIRGMARAMDELAAGQLEPDVGRASSAAEFQQMSRALATFRDNAVEMQRLDLEAGAVREREAESQARRTALQAAIARVVTTRGAGRFLASHRQPLRRA